MTLEEYRLHVVERLRSADDTVAARGVLGEVDLTLTRSRLSPKLEQHFWQTLHHDLNIVADGAGFLHGFLSAPVPAIAVAAQTWIERNHLGPTRDQNG